jgi:hypothetical protein
MTTLTMLIGLATLGVETGWQPVDDGALEYIIQIEPSLLDALRDGQPITSEIPAELKGVRRYKIVVGKAQLPRTDLPAPPGSTPAGPTALAQGSPGTPPPPAASLPGGSLPGGSLPSGSLPGGSLPGGSLPGGSLPGGSLPGGSSPAVTPPAAAAAALPPDRYALPFSQAGVPFVPPAAGAGGPPAGQSASPNPPSPNPAAPGGVAFPLGSPPPAGPAATTPFTPGSSLPAEVPPPPTTAGPTASPGEFLPDVKAADLAGGSLVVPQANRSPDTQEMGDKSGSDHPATAAEVAPSKPWLPLLMTTLVLLVSLGGNLYLGLIAWDARHHYRKLVRQTIGREPTGVVEFPEDAPLIVGDRISSIHT